MKNGKITRRYKRKGIVDVQFNWIFVMIAGVTIFLFIISIAFSQKNAAEKRSDMRAINQISTLLKDKQQSNDVFSDISFPKTELTFRCEKDNSNDVEIGLFTMGIGKSDPKQMETDIIFAPQQMNTDNMIVWSKAFTAGFPVGSFVYITTKDLTIIIYNNSDYAGYASAIYRDLPDNVTKNITTNLNAYRNHKNIKIICFDEGTKFCPDDLSHDYIAITPGNSLNSRLFDYGEVTFHTKTGIDSRKAYLSKAGLYGAIFSDNSRYYECQMLRALNQFEIKRSLVEKRLLLMMNELGDGECKNNMQVILEEDILPISNPALNYGNATLIGRNSRDLDIRNEKLIIISCPTIY